MTTSEPLDEKELFARILSYAEQLSYDPHRDTYREDIAAARAYLTASTPSTPSDAGEVGKLLWQAEQDAAELLAEHRSKARTMRSLAGLVASLMRELRPQPAPTRQMARTPYTLYKDERARAEAAEREVERLNGVLRDADMAEYCSS